MISSWIYSIWTFIEGIKKKILIDAKIEIMISRNSKNSPKKSLNKTKNLLRIVADYVNGVLVDYIKGISSIIEFID